MGYTLATIKELSQLGHEIHIIHWNNKKITPFAINQITNVFFYNRSDLSKNAISVLLEKINPSIVVVSGLMDMAYLWAISKSRNKKIPIIMALDTQWNGTIKQYFAVSLGILGIFKFFFSHAWVPGVFQFEFARKIGFSKNQIIYNLYSADINIFSEFNKRSEAKDYPHRFIFVGRLEESKGLKLLLEAWHSIESNRKDWELHIIGNGALSDFLKNKKNIFVKNFLQPETLVNELKMSGCLILPSTYEPWGVIVHESTAAGLPLILSNKVGARTEFLISGLNGYIFKNKNAIDLAEKLLLFINKSDDELFEMSKHSNYLSTKISPQSSAMNLLSILE
jgi:glycosyltransferase involved in cell wall biosynthesis